MLDINIKDICDKSEEEIKQFSKACIIRPSVAVINIGDSAINERFVKAKESACNRVGIYFRYHNFEEGTPELTIINKIKELNNDDYVNGIMVNLPIPDRYNEKRILNSIINSKDIDGLTDINIGRLTSGRKSIAPCAAQGIMELLKQLEVPLESKEVVLIGNSKQIGRPLINMFLDEGSTVTICNSKTNDLSKYTKNADIIVSSTGQPNLITADMIKEGSIVIDGGYNVDEKGKVCGDVDYNKVSKKASYVSPVPGGVGTMTVSVFLKNIILCYNNKNK